MDFPRYSTFYLFIFEPIYKFQFSARSHYCDILYKIILSWIYFTLLGVSVRSLRRKIRISLSRILNALQVYCCFCAFILLYVYFIGSYIRCFTLQLVAVFASLLYCEILKLKVSQIYCSSCDLILLCEYLKVHIFIKACCNFVFFIRNLSILRFLYLMSLITLAAAIALVEFVLQNMNIVRISKGFWKPIYLSLCP